jgi:hypothetical protein
VTTSGQRGLDITAPASTLATARAGGGGARSANGPVRQDAAWLELLPRSEQTLPLSAADDGMVIETAGGTGDLDARDPRDLMTIGASSGQLLAAAHTIAAHLVTGTQRLLDAASEALVPGGASTVAIRLGYVTPEGGHAEVELQHPDLGDVGLEISLTGRALSVLATTLDERAAAAIREGQATLAQRLLAQGITLHALDVVVLRRREQHPERKPKRQETTK